MDTEFGFSSQKLPGKRPNLDIKIFVAWCYSPQCRGDNSSNIVVDFVKYRVAIKSRTKVKPTIFYVYKNHILS